METVLVEVECIKSTAADIDHFEKDVTYTVDMAWAKRRDIWKYFRPLREVPNREAEERVHDEILPARDAQDEERARINEEAVAKQAKQKPSPAKSFPGPTGHAKRGYKKK